MGIAGYVTKSGSPSCGLRDVPIAGSAGARARGRGVFAAALVARLSLLPIVEEGELDDPDARESFFERVFAYAKLARLFAAGWKRSDVARFHQSEAERLRARDRRAYERLGRLLEKAGRRDLANRYRAGFLAALAKPAPTSSARRPRRARDGSRATAYSGPTRRRSGSPRRSRTPPGPTPGTP
jgi:hypothetical protein